MLVLLFVLGVVALWLYANYVSALSKKKKTIIAFENVDKELKNRDELIGDIIADSQIYNDDKTIQYINNLKAETAKLGTNPKFINRKIAFENELRTKADEYLENIKKNIDIVSNNELYEKVNSYDRINEKISTLKQEYNKAAVSLRKAVDVFPSSFVSRLGGIKSFDYMK